MSEYQESWQQTVRQFESSEEKGLSTEESVRRLQQYGQNELKESGKETPLQIFLNQFKDFLVAILIFAIFISIIAGEYSDAITVAIILLINAALGFSQEYKAEKAIEALKKMSSLKAKVIRDGQMIKIDVSAIVPGDILAIETGDKIPADCRIIEAHNLEVQEAALTGESVPVAKHSDKIEKETAMADRKNMLFSGTIITKGRGKAVITATGMKTELGKIATMIQEARPDMTPLQKKLKSFGKQLGIIVLAICALIFATNFLRGEPWASALIFAIALAVAAVPEGLPAVVTTCLSLGVRRLVAKNALVRKLPSVETLGSTTVICTDKTGTLTCNEMTVRKIYTNRKTIDVSGQGYSTEGNLSEVNPQIKKLLMIGALCNDASIKEGKINGDPTEIALIVSAAKAGVLKEESDSKHPRVDEIPFDSDRKLMTTLHTINGTTIGLVKGAPDNILRLCSKIEINGKAKKLTPDHRNEILRANEEFANNALRVLGFAYKPLPASATEKCLKRLKTQKQEKLKFEENNLVFVGLQAMIDPPRQEAKEAVARCKEAGIRVIMITGDHKTTAVAIARELGIEGKAMLGEEIEKMSGIYEIIKDVSIFARVSPEHKLKIIEALKFHNEIVAMTGDGVNDAPALKKADIGIAMGITGTDVAKEASDMILTDDNFASIVNAVEEGRHIFDNIKKFIFFLLSSNLSEIMVIFFALLLALPTPLLAIQILWINIVTDGFPALAIGLEPAESNVMKRKPRDPGESIITKKTGIRMLILAAVIAGGTLTLFYYYLANFSYAYAVTVAFTALVVFELFNALNARSENTSVFKLGIFKNRWLLAAITFSVLLQMFVIYTPSVAKAFGVVPLLSEDWVLIVIVASSVLWVDEGMKLFRKKI